MFFERFRRYRQVRNTQRELGRLTDRELSDIGIARSEINSVARKASR